MNSTAIIALYAIRFGIPAAKELALLFAKPEPTAEDWNKVWTLSDKSFEDYVGDAAARLASAAQSASVNWPPHPPPSVGPIEHPLVKDMRGEPFTP